MKLVSSKLLITFFNYMKRKSNNFYSVTIEDYWVQPDHLYIVLLRIRFKSTVLKLYINDLANDKTLLKQLHPYDAYFIGILSYMQQQHMLTNQLCDEVQNIDHDSVMSVPCIEFTGLDLSSNQLVFKLVDYPQEIKFDITKIYKDKTIIAAMSNQSAFDVGRVVSHYFMEGYLV